jgi:hypothetical protein
VSGGIAGLAGVLFAYDQGNVVAGTFDPQYSIILFLAAATAGVSSVGWTVSGVMLLEVTVAFGPRLYDLLGGDLSQILPQLVTGPLLLISLYFYPGGSAQNGFDQRDAWLRRIAERRQILVPSLVADRLVDAEEQELIVEAERSVASFEEGGEEGDQSIFAPPVGPSRGRRP